MNLTDMTLKIYGHTAGLLACGAMLWCAPTAMGAETAHAMPELYGSVIYADGWSSQENAIGMYSIPTNSEMEFRRLGTSRIDASGGGVMIGDTYWVCNFVDYLGTPFVMVMSYDSKTWEEKTFAYGDTPVISTGVAYDPVTKNVYGCFRNDTNTGYVFGTVDYTALKRTRIADLDRMWSAVAINRQGTLYAIDELGDLYTVSKTDGAMTKVGSTGLTASHPSSACIDYRSGDIYYALTDSPEGALYKVDPSTAAPTLIYRFPKNQEVVGLYTPMPEAADGAPDQTGDLKIDFEGGALTGTLSFTAPATTFDGSAGTGELKYTLEGNGSVLATGKCDWGQRTSVSVILPEAGQYHFRFYFTNGAGSSPALEQEGYKGPDTPLAPDCAMKREGDEVTITLTPVTATVHDGYADFAGMKYEVLRIPDNKRLTAGEDGLTFKDGIPTGGDLRSYRYVANAYYMMGESSVKSDVTETEKVWTGAATPPYASVFDAYEASEPYTAVDANNDGVTWGWNEEYKAFATSFNRQSDNDDWLMTPALNLKKGKVYKATVTMRTYLGNPEYAEIACGRTPTAKGMTRVILSRSLIKTREAQDFVVYITPDEDGVWYLGVHNVSGAYDSWYLYVDSIRIEAGVTSDVPGAPTDLKVVPDYDGGLTARISLSAPVLTESGKTLDSLTRIDLLRDGILVKTFESPVPGKTLEYDDIVPAYGYHVYTAVPFNSEGEGRSAEVRVYVGVNSPAKPAWAAIEETETPGEVRVTWERVSTASDGTPLNPDLVKYDLMTVDDTHGGEAYTAVEGTSGTEAVIQVPGTDKYQKFAYYAVKAVTATDYSLMTLTPFLPVGPAYTLPYAESFAGGRAKSLMRPDDGMAMWSIYMDDAGIPAHDADHGMAAMFGELYGAESTLYTGKVSLKGSVNPVLAFYTYNISGEDADMNELYVSVGVGTDFKEVRSIVMSDLGTADGWYPVVVPLDEYKGKEVQFSFRGVTRNRKYTLIDDITVNDGLEHDVRAGLISAPAAVAPGEEFTLEASVENTGRSDMASVDVTLYCNDEPVESREVESVKAGKSVVVGFTLKHDALSDEENVYWFTVEAPQDDNTGNNRSATVAVTVLFPAVPSPSDLQGESALSGVTLRWNGPDLDAIAPKGVTEDFESWTPWSKEGECGWTFVDKDGAGIGAIQNVQFPGIDYNTTLSWFVLDSSAQGLGNDYAAASGEKYLSTFFCLPLGDFRYVANDDWAISPLLYGGAQRISFKARSVNPSEAEESFEVLYTTEDTTDTSRFIPLEKVEEVPGVWTEYSYSLPAGACRFAVRYNKTYGFMLHIDDVSYIPAGETDLTLTGYYVYRDGERVTASPIGATEYSEDFRCVDPTEYRVSAVYSDGTESRASEGLVLSLGDSVSDPCADSFRIGVEHGEVVVVGVEGETVRVADTSGRMVLTRLCSATERIALPKGVWLLTVGARTVKIML